MRVRVSPSALFWLNKFLTVSRFVRVKELLIKIKASIFIFLKKNLFALANIFVLIFLARSLSVFKKQESFKMKADVYTQSLGVINKLILSATIKNPGIYIGKDCGNEEPSFEERNNIYTRLAFVTENPVILQNYLYIMSSEHINLIKERDKFISLLRKDLGFNDGIDFTKINSENTFLIKKDCVKTVD